jgi:hypothetical protein
MHVPLELARLRQGLPAQPSTSDQHSAEQVHDKRFDGYVAISRNVYIIAFKGVSGVLLVNSPEAASGLYANAIIRKELQLIHALTCSTRCKRKCNNVVGCSLIKLD